MRDVVDGELREKQAGFRSRRSHAERIFALPGRIEKCPEQQVPLAIYESVLLIAQPTTQGHIRAKTRIFLSV